MTKVEQSLMDVAKDLKQLIRLQRVKLEEELLYTREWHPLYFLILCDGDSSYGRWRYTYYGSNSKTQTPLVDKANTYPYAYQFHSIQMVTKNRNYYPSIRLNINGKLYPSTKKQTAFQFIQKDIADDGAFGEYERKVQNYEHGRMFAAWMKSHYQSNWADAEYPFKLKVDKNWVLNFYCYATGTNVYVHLLINGWKLRERSKDAIAEILEAKE